MNMKRIVYLIFGCLCLGIGCAGIALPVLPTVPFFLVTVFCFANSSQRMYNWFVGTKMYKKHLESFVQKRGMTVKTKVGIIISATLMIGFGFLLMKNVPVGRIILAVVWVCHIIYFVFGVKHIKEDGNR